MDLMSLKDYRTDAADLPREDPDTPTPSSLYLKDRNALKIDKLSIRVTIISIILPILIGAVLFFIYLDMKDQVMDVDSAKNTRVEHLSRQMEEKLNALDIRIAKNRFDLDEKLPVLEQKTGSLEQQLEKLAASKADVSVLEAELTELGDQLARQDRRIQNNADQDQANLAELERINSSLRSAMDENQGQFEKEVRTLKQEITSLQALKQEVASLQTQSQAQISLQEQLDEKRLDLERLQKQVSLLEKQHQELENQFMTRKEVNRQLTELQNNVNQALKNMENQIKSPPLQIPDSISEETLTQ
jgi:chromosome segregation ATPase